MKHAENLNQGFFYKVVMWDNENEGVVKVTSQQVFVYAKRHMKPYKF